jgi:LacI family transcriptional regulator
MKNVFKPSKRPGVALLVESSRGYGRDILSGIARFIREHNAWSVYFQDLNLCDHTPEWLARWRGRGIIARLENDDILKVIQRLKVPAVFLRHVDPGAKIPCILTDNAAVSKLGYQHLKERGFRHFAFCGFNGADYSDERKQEFVRLTASDGSPCHVYSETQPLKKNSTANHEILGLRDGAQVAAWIRRLPKPVGLMACNDMRGQQVLDACRAVGVAVPEEMAVIGVDNDEVICDLSEPPLSSVVTNAERIGYEAAALLARMMAGGKVRRKEIYIEPNRIVTRRSTEVLAIDNRRIAAAARFIREHACEGIDVTDVLRSVPVSRSFLTQQFNKYLGRSPKAEIQRVRLQRATELLCDTDWPVKRISEEAGFYDQFHFSRVFKKEYHHTPSQHREKNRT